MGVEAAEILALSRRMVAGDPKNAGSTVWKLLSKAAHTPSLL